MVNYLLDTNHASRLMAKEPSFVLRVQQLSATSNLGISMTVLAELYFAVYASQYRARNLTQLHSLVDRVSVWSFDRMAAEEFGKIQAEQKAKGRPIPAMDAQIAAVARVNRFTLLTADRHFQYIEYLSTENWL